MNLLNKKSLSSVKGGGSKDGGGVKRKGSIKSSSKSLINECVIWMNLSRRFSLPALPL